MNAPRESVVHGQPASPSPTPAVMPAKLPALDRLLRLARLAPLLESHGETLVTNEARALLQDLREQALAGSLSADRLEEEALAQALEQHLQRRLAPRLRGVLNLSGTVIHTNLGRASLPAEALQHMQQTLRQPVNLEYDLATGERGDRDDLVEGLLQELTGAEAATVVNNNAAAVLLTLAALAQGREVVVSRGELVEIGGSFRLPDIMGSAGVRLVEVGTTNRTHPRDYERAIGPGTALLLKVHTSNYKVQGFTTAVDESALCRIARARGLPVAVDLGSGALADLAALGLPPEPMPQQALQAGCDIVTFSGDKLLGGPQTGLIVGRRELVDRIRRHPLKRALRCGKITLAALEATLRLYLEPEHLPQRLPTLRLLTRPLTEIEATARELLPALRTAVGDAFEVSVVPLQSQIGSGSLPVERLPSAGLALRPVQRKGAGTALQHLRTALRGLPLPVVGRIKDGRLLLDLRCLEDPAPLLGQLDALAGALAATGAGVA